VVGEAADGLQAVARARELAPDVVVLDLRLPGLNGIQATRAIKRELPGTQVVIFTAYDDPGLARGAAQAGAFAYLVKGCPPAELGRHGPVRRPNLQASGVMRSR
jgi:DNA-binding NarL/FixJ family response regulator